MNLWFILLATGPMMVVIGALLRQLNRERDERAEMMLKYRELALRVRATQLAWEGPAQEMGEEESYRHYLNNPLSTVDEVEGSL